MFGFIFSFIRAVSSEVKAAHVAQRVTQHIPRNRFTCWIVDSASLWIYRKTTFRDCMECGEFVIDEEYPEIHDSCLTLLRHEEQLERDADAEFERSQIEAWQDEQQYEKFDALPPMSIYDYFDLRVTLDQNEVDYCHFCRESPCICEDEDPLKGDVEPTGGYPEESYLAPTGYGTFERVYYDPTDTSTWPFPMDDSDDDEEN